MATIVYDGGGEGGNLFAGTKFFFVQRLPSRQTWIDLVKANGGEIVKIDKQAHIIIADHARKHCPPGSISWKYIQESVRDGELKNMEMYLAGPSAQTPRAIGSGEPRKKGRTPFTAEDDHVLTKWVLEAERKGISTKGNEIYIQLESKNPRHPAQAWRDRWIKYVSHYSRPEPEDDSPRSSPGSDGPVAGVKQSNQKPVLRSKALHVRALQSNMSSEPRSEPPSQTSRLAIAPRSPPTGDLEARSTAEPGVSTAGATRPYITKPAGGEDFSKDDMRLLVNGYAAIMNLDEDQATDAWQALAAEYPNHTAQEWRNYFIKEVAPLMQEARKQLEKASPGRTPNRVSTIIAKPSSSREDSYRDRSNSHLQLSNNQVPESQPPTVNEDLPITGEEAFIENLTAFADGQDLKVEFNPVICGRTVPLFKLWKIVRSDEFGGFDEVTKKRLWPLVSRKLDFNDHTSSKAAGDLESYYRKILFSFDEGQDEYYETTELSESEEQAMIESQLRKTAARETQRTTATPLEDDSEGEKRGYLDDPDMPLSLPLQQSPVSTSKRRLENIPSNHGASSLAWSPSKRQRIEKEKGRELEIPSTPEEQVDNEQHPQSAGKIEQLKFASPIVTEPEEEDSDPELFRSSFKGKNLSPTPTRPARRIIEPETQDFDFSLPRRDEIESPLPPSFSSRSEKTRNENRSFVTRDSLNQDPSTQTQREYESATELNAFIERYISLGYSQDHIIQALDATTMNTGDVGIVLENLSHDDSIPEYIQGVWTSWDDEAVEGEDQPRYEKVVEKHGMARVAVRRRFLADQRVARNLLSRGATDT